MKILHVLPALTKGGAERVAAELLNEGVKHGDDMTLLAGWPVDPTWLQHYIDPAVDIRFLSKEKYGAYFGILPWVIKNRKWLAGFDVIHCHLTYGAAFGSTVFIILKKLGRRKLPVIVETNHTIGMKIPVFNRWLQSRMLLQRDGVILMAKDPYWVNYMNKHPERNIEIIPNGVAVFFSPESDVVKQNFRTTYHIPADCKYVVGTVGVMRPDRQPWMYVPIFKMINDVFGNDVHFIIAGNGAELEPVRQKVADAGLAEKVHMPGLINNPAETISRMDVYVSLSVGATTGISMIEAALCEVPVVGIQLVADYTAKETDWVWSHTDPEKVAQQIIALLQNEDERNKVAASQHAYATTHFTSAKMFDSCYAFYKKLMQ